MQGRTSLFDRLVECFERGTPLSEILDPDCIRSLSEDASAEVRFWTAKALAFERAEVAVDLLCRLASDEDELVRVEAVDVLGAFSVEQSFETLCRAMEDPDELVRAYAAFGVAAVGKAVSPQKTKEVLDRAAEGEQSGIALSGIYEGQFLLGDAAALDRLTALFGPGDYHVRCLVLRALGEVMDGQSRPRIKAFLDSLAPEEFPVSVREAYLETREKYFSEGYLNEEETV